MRIWRNMSVACKFLVCFGGLLSLIVLLTLLTMKQANQVKDSVRVTTDESVKYALIAKDMKLKVVQVQQWLTDISATRATEGFDDGFTMAEENAASFLSDLTTFRDFYQSKSNQEQVQTLNDIEVSFNEYLKMGNTMAQGYIDGGPETGNKFMALFDANAEDINRKVDLFVESSLSSLDNNILQVSSSLDSMLRNALFVSIFSFLIMVVIGIGFTKAITGPIQQALEFSKRVAAGDLTYRVVCDRKDEFGVLLITLNEMSGNLNNLVGNIQDSATQVSASSEELSASSQSLANASTEQAASIEETSAAVEELASSIEQNAQNANDTDEITRKSVKDVEEGSASVLDTVQAMKRIAQQIEIVNDIADQTNLLALNAAIEAARAGEMGKGFAVVAVEVRKLAERSQQAAKEISQLSKDSVKTAESAGERIQSVVPSIQKAAQLMQEISASCAEQSNGASQIRQSMGQLDAVTQQNSAAGEQSASSSEELAAQAQSMQQLVSHFKIKSSSTSASLFSTTPQISQSAKLKLNGSNSRHNGTNGVKRETQPVGAGQEFESCIDEFEEF